MPSSGSSTKPATSEPRAEPMVLERVSQPVRHVSRSRLRAIPAPSSGNSAPDSRDTGSASAAASQATVAGSAARPPATSAELRWKPAYRATVAMPPPARRWRRVPVPGGAVAAMRLPPGRRARCRQHDRQHPGEGGSARVHEQVQEAEPDHLEGEQQRTREHGRRQQPPRPRVGSLGAHGRGAPGDPRPACGSASPTRPRRPAARSPPRTAPSRGRPATPAATARPASHPAPRPACSSRTAAPARRRSSGRAPRSAVDHHRQRGAHGRGRNQQQHEAQRQPHQVLEPRPVTQQLEQRRQPGRQRLEPQHDQHTRYGDRQLERGVDAQWTPQPLRPSGSPARCPARARP